MSQPKPTQVMLSSMILKNEHGMPALFAVVPATRGFFSVSRIVRLGQHKYKLFLVCQCCHRMASCGRKGRGFSVFIDGPTLKLLAPVLQLSLLLALAAVKAGLGVSLPLGADSAVMSAMLEHTSELVGAGLARAVEDVCGGDEGARELAKGRVVEATGPCYKHLEAVLGKEDKEQRFFGLSHIDGGGQGTARSARLWVCPLCEPGFVKDGNAFKPAYPGPK